MNSFTSKYEIIDKLGEGSFSEVLKCLDKLTGEQYAAKRLKRVFKTIREVTNCAEITATNKLKKHPNIVYMQEYHYDPISGRLVFIFELMDMSMYDFIKVKKRRLAEVKVKSYLYQVLKGLNHLHSNGLFHRDIKPENILIKLTKDCNNPPYQQRPFININYASYVNKMHGFAFDFPMLNFRDLNNNHEGFSSLFKIELVKLADFGSIRGIFTKPPYTEYISTRWYRSPECLLSVGYYGSKMDIWAMGLKPLFAGQNEIDQLNKIHAILGTPSERILRKLKKRSRNFSNFRKQLGIGLRQVSPNISDEAISLLQLMLHYDPDIRINVRRLLDASYFKDLRQDELIDKYNQQKLKIPPIMNKILGDFHSYTSKAQPKYKKIPISRSSERLNKKKDLTVFQMHSKTMIEISNYESNRKTDSYKLQPALLPLVNSKQMKTWGVKTNILKAKPVLTISSITNNQFKLQSKPVIKQREYSKTMSNLPQISNEMQLENKKRYYFQSKSFILPSRHIMAPIKIKDIGDLKHYRHQL